MINAFAGLTALLIAQLIGFQYADNLPITQQLNIYQTGFIKVTLLGIIITIILFIIHNKIDKNEQQNIY